jgi:hypothetical protein
MRQYLVVLDMDLPATAKQLDPDLASYLAARQEQEPCEVVVLSLVDTRQTKLPAMELALGAQAGKFPVAPKPDHDISKAAEQRMTSAVQHLKAMGCQVSGAISDEDLAKAVRSEALGHDYDEVILATGRHAGTWLARLLGRDPVYQLRRHWGRRLTVFAPQSPARPADI